VCRRSGVRRSPSASACLRGVERERPRAGVVLRWSLTRLRNPRQDWGSGPEHRSQRIGPGAQSSAQSRFSVTGPKRRKSGWNAGLRMARPGLEPGTPRFSVVGAEASNWPEAAANRWVPSRRQMRGDCRKKRSFAVDLGTQVGPGAQSLPAPPRVRTAPTLGIYLLRRAKSSWKDVSLPDRERPLAGRGRRAATSGGVRRRRGTSGAADAVAVMTIAVTTSAA
jgi:hypothetical protein